MNRQSLQEQVWITNKDEGYLLVVIDKKSDEGVHYTLHNKQHSTKVFYPYNPSLLHTISDLCMLSYLHEPAILNTLKQRYLQQNIYTWSGLVLIAINPFKHLPIYDNNMIAQYQNSADNLDPHIFMIAKTSYTGLSLSNQSIIVSGESGAGKTQSAKYLMKYITGQNTLELSDIESAVLATNPLTEAFGNAKTVRNDNSSRFGKYLEMLFIRQNDQYKIVGAKMSTFLLERSRIVYQPANERNYHIFYQLVKGCALAERKSLYLNNVSDLNYIKTCPTIDNVNDQQEFTLTQQAFSQIGISVAMQWKVFQVLAGILHLGNIKFGHVMNKDIELDDSVVLDDEVNNSCHYACELLGLDKDLFKQHLTEKTIHMRSEVIVKPLLIQDAIVNRDAVAKYMYTYLFDWLILQINHALMPNKTDSSCFIGILDIFGFEHFKVNSFEQFCINYANEKLQQEFTQHVFKVEQQRYVDEGIEWQFIDFQDNQPCIALIEDKLGILSILDEEVLLPGGNDKSFINKLYSQFAQTSRCFSKAKFGQESFIIKHYAYDVEYQMDGFIDKNKDSIPEEISNLLLGSKNELLIEMLPTQQKKRSTLGNTFKMSLIELMKTISSTEVSYIRCIKPNTTKSAFHFDPLLVLSQLRACGVLETIRISSAGYPGRMAYDEFINRYYLLTSFKHRQLKKRELVLLVLKSVLDDPLRSDKLKVDLYQLGQTKIFFRAGELAYLEKCRDKRLRQSAIMIQKNIRKMIYRNRYTKLRSCTIKCQSYIRTWLALRSVAEIRKSQAALTIQKYCRMYIVRHSFLLVKQSALSLQTQFRGFRVRGKFANKRKEAASIKIQRVYRGYLSRKSTKRQLKLIVFLQSCIRRKKALKVLKSLKIEAKSVHHLQTVSYKLENKVVQLTLQNQSKDALIKELEGKLQICEQNMLQWKEKCMKLETSTKTTSNSKVKINNTRLIEVEQKCKTLTTSAAEYLSKLSLVENEYKAMKDINEKLNKDKNHLEQQLQIQIDKLTNINVLEQQVKKLKIEISKMNEDEYISDNISPASPQDKGNVLTALLFNQSDRIGEDEDETMLETRQLKDLLDNTALQDELLKYFIHRLPEIPLFVIQLANIWDITNNELQMLRKEILYPSHILAMYVIKKWQMGIPLKSFLIILKAIDEKIDTDGYKLITYWTSNLHELQSIIKSVKAQKSKALGLRESTDLSEHGKEMLKIQNEIDRMFNKGFQRLYAQLRLKFQKYAIPSILENQSLPGFVTKEDGGFFQRLGYASEKHSIEDLVDQLTDHIKILKGYALDDLIIAQLFGELIRLLSIDAFNHLLMRRSFSTWKRGIYC
eukprot:NODE_8_length_47770_cov_0.334354.p1 type:complete len:1329 gc:universal NODE_8_length_47770_cov_0.334354:37749-41735(+)